MAEVMNPYTAGDPVGKTSAFVGRLDILREVNRVLRHPSQNAITLFGQRRIGKTSILQHLETILLDQDSYQPVYYDLMGKAGRSLGDILRDLARTISRVMNQPDPDLGNAPELAFRETYLPGVLHHLPQDQSLVLLLDEFDVLADPQAEQEAKRAFFGYLRELRLFAPERLQFIFVLGRNLDDLDIVARGLFKDLPSKRVSLLGRKDTETLIRISEPNAGLTWTPGAVDRVWSLTAGHPYLTQALCSQVWEDAHDASDEPQPVHPEDVDEAVAGALERSHNMFVWLWDGLNPAEKVVAAALASAGSTVVDEERLSLILAESGVRILIGELRDAPRILQEWDILSPADGGYRFRVEIMRRWIAENKPISRTQEELDRINPVANSLFEAARGYYLDENLGQAEGLLKQALEVNPNHIRANELLAEILLAKGDLEEAQQILERLEQMTPGKARLRLKQIYLRHAETTADIGKKLEWYDQILSLLPDDPQARNARRQIFRDIGRKALQAEDFHGALQAFEKAGDSEVLVEIADLIQQRDVENGVAEVRQLEDTGAYRAAHERARVLADMYPDERDWQPELDRLMLKTSLNDKYRTALGALQQGDRATAQRLLTEVFALDPEHEETIRYLYLAMTGEDPQASRNATNPEVREQNVALSPPQDKPSALPTPSPGRKRKMRPVKRPQPNRTQKSDPPPRLSVWNPLDYLRLLAWILVRPESLEAFRQADGKDNEKPVGYRLGFTLIFLLLLMPLLGLGLGLLPLGETTWSVRSYLLWALGIVGAWVLLQLGANLLLGENFSGVEGDKWLVVSVGWAISLFAAIAMFGVAVGVAVGVAAGVAIGIAFSLAIGMACRVISRVSKEGMDDFATFAFLLVGGGWALVMAGVMAVMITGGGGLEVALIAVLIVAIGGALDIGHYPIWLGVGLVAGAIVGGITVWSSGRWMADSFLQTIISVAAGCGALIVAALVVGFGFLLAATRAEKPAPRALFSLVLSWLILAFLSFGGLTWLRSGVWPLPVWPL